MDVPLDQHTKMAKMPKQKPGRRSKQDYGTPWEFIRAVEARFGKLDIDLAGTERNKKAPKVITPEQDSLGSAAHLWPMNRRCWLNPPFSRIGPWAAACSMWRSDFPKAGVMDKSRIFFLTPASVGANWFRGHVYGKALVLFLCSNEHGSGRLTFEGEKDPYPKDLILSVYGEPPGFEMWGWRLPK
mgnify:FL=1